MKVSQNDNTYSITLFRFDQRGMGVNYSKQISSLLPVWEEDVPRASLGGHNPEQIKVPELKLWLACRS